jgi:hypothetical protein
MNMDTKTGVSWLEVIVSSLLVVLGMGTWAVVEREVNDWRREGEPRAEQISQHLLTVRLRKQLAAAEAELQATQEKLVEERLERIAWRMTLEALEASYPALTRHAVRAAPPTSSTAPATRPATAPVTAPAFAALDEPDAETRKAYTDARVKWQVASALTDVLGSRVVELQGRLAEQSAAAAESDRAARLALEEATDRFKVRGRLITMSIAAGVAAGTLLLAAAVVRILHTARRHVVRPGVVILASTAALAVLFGYQAFQSTGAAVIALLVVACVLACTTRTDTRIESDLPANPEGPMAGRREG